MKVTVPLGMSDWLVEKMSTKELLKPASIKSGGVSVDHHLVIFIPASGMYVKDKWCVDSLGIRD